MSPLCPSCKSFRHGLPFLDDKELAQFAWLRELLKQQKDVKDPVEFLETVKVDLFSDEV